MLEITPASFLPFAHLEAGTGNRASIDATRLPPQKTKRGRITTHQAYRQDLGVV